MCIRDRLITCAADLKPPIREYLLLDPKPADSMPITARPLLSLIHISEPTRPY